MKSFLICENDAGQRADRFLSKAVPALPASLLQRYLRVKRIKLNGKRCQNAAILAAGDRLDLYINDEFFAPSSQNKTAFLSARGPVDILYEDQNLILLDKRPGLVVHEDDTGGADTLINRLRRILYDRGEYDPAAENSFAPALCNRLDRNTGGIVIAAKNAATLRVMNTLLRERLLEKRYLCLVHGVPKPASATLKGYLIKDEAKRQVEIFDRPRAGAKTILTRYETLDTSDAASLLEVTLLTGRTHQIRAHLAHAGYPLIGDTKYGRNRENKWNGFRYQALYSYRLRFLAEERLEHLSYLGGREFQIPPEQIWFYRDFTGRIKTADNQGGGRR